MAITLPNFFYNSFRIMFCFPVSSVCFCIFVCGTARQFAVLDADTRNHLCCGHLLVSTVDCSAMVAYESYMDLLTHKSCTDFQVMVFMSHHIILS